MMSPSWQYKPLVYKAENSGPKPSTLAYPNSAEMSAQKQIGRVFRRLKIKVKYRVQCYIETIIYHINKTPSAMSSFHTKDNGTLALIKTIKHPRKSISKVQEESQNAELANYFWTMHSTRFAWHAPWPEVTLKLSKTQKYLADKLSGWFLDVLGQYPSISQLASLYLWPSL